MAEKGRSLQLRDLKQVIYHNFIRIQKRQNKTKQNKKQNKNK